MTNKPLSKLLSVIIAIAICASTVFGCLVTVNALDTPSYVITGDRCTIGQTTASATVEFTASSGIAGGNFIINNEGDWYSSVEASFIGVKSDDTDQIFAQANMRDNQSTVLFYITDEKGTAKNYTTVTLKLDFVFVEGGISEDVEITISGLELTDSFEDPYTNVANNSTDHYFTAGCRHSFVVSDQKVYASEELGYTVYNGAVCSKCSETKTDYQLVPEVEDKGGEIVVYTGAASSALAVELHDTNSENSESNPYIIETPEQLHALAIGALKNSNGDLVSEIGAYFKVKDDIEAFVMQSSVDKETIMSYSSGDEIVNLSSKKTWWSTASGTSGKFNGHFDGNGVAIYGVYAEDQSTGLFPVISGNSTIKNFVIKNSYIATSGGAGVAAVVGKTSTDNVGTVVIENVTVANNHIEMTNSTRNAGASAVVGYLHANYTVKINNCLIYDNNIINPNDSAQYGLISYVTTDAAESVEIKNIISIGTSPVTVNGVSCCKTLGGNIKNIYTDVDCAGIVGSTYSNKTEYNFNDNIELNVFKGNNAASIIDTLNQNDGTDKTVWFAGKAGQYPTLLKKAPANVADTTSHDWKLLGMNIEYKNDGSFALNFHYEPSYESDVTLYLVNAKEEYKSQILTEYKTSNFAGTTLSADAKMFTISNLSAKDMDILWLPTIVANSEAGDAVVYSETKQISITDYAKAVVLGKVFYDKNANDAEKLADKNVAAALINYNKASEDALAIKTPVITATVVEKWDRYENGKNVGWYNSSLSGDGTAESPYIIDSAEKLAYVCAQATDTEGKYYKVDPSIKAFDMNTSGIDLSSNKVTATEVQQKLADERVLKAWTLGTDACFAGDFDGNGVEIYGLRAGMATNTQGYQGGYTYAALFSYVDTSAAKIKSIHIKNSYFIGECAGAIFGYTNYSNGSIVIENCTVSNCYIQSTGGYTAGAIGGRCQYSGTENISDKVLINNCLVYGNSIVNTTNEEPRLIGTMDPWHYNGSNKVQSPEHYSIKNTVAIDCAIAKNNYWQNEASLYKNCYTTATNDTTATTVSKLTSADNAKGIAAMTNMSALDWDTIWLYGKEGEYPSIVPTDAKVDPISEYSGTPDTTSTLSGSGSSTDPYIIETADQFAAVVLGKTTYTAGSYFRVADGIKSFYMNGGETLANLTSAAEVESYFETNGGYGWSSSWDRGTAGKSFCGHFDGNGVTIYGLYDNASDGTDGLFEAVEGTTTISNFTLKNSYFVASSGAGVAPILTRTSSAAGTADTVTIEKVAVINNHIEQTNAGQSAGASAMVGYLYASDVVKINNCLIYGNNIVNPNVNASTGLVTYIATTSAETKIENVISIGVAPVTLNGNASIRVLKDGNFKNIYTNIDCASIVGTTYSESDKTKYNFNDKIALSDLQGAKAKDTIGDEFNWDTTWFAGAYNDYPSLTPVGILPSNIQAIYDGMNLEKYDSFGNSTDKLGVYSTTLVLKSNPYMSFIFALDDYRKYKGNGGDITITFSDNKGNTIESITANDMINSESNGRYHKYYLRDIPVISLSTGITVTANAGGESHNLGTYSVEGFALAVLRENRLNPCDYYSTRYNAAKALVFYTQMLAARYGENV